LRALDFENSVHQITLNNPAKVWARRVELLDSQLATPIVRDVHRAVAWQDSATFDNATKVLRNLQTRVPQFFCTFDYSWMYERESYDFPQEALFQLFAVDAALGLWHSTPEDKQAEAVFNGLCPRLNLHWTMDECSPRALPVRSEDLGFRLITVPSGWLDMTDFSINALIADNPDDFSLDDFLYTQAPDEDAVRPFWQALMIRALAGAVHCPESLVAEFVQVLGEKTGAPVYQASAKRMTSVLQLSTLCQRYSMAHEVGHHAEVLFQTNSPQMDTESMADRLAMYAL